VSYEDGVKNEKGLDTILQGVAPGFITGRGGGFSTPSLQARILPG